MLVKILFQRTKIKLLEFKMKLLAKRIYRMQEQYLKENENAECN